MKPAFSFQFGHQICCGTVVLAKFDGEKPSLAAVTSGGRVLIHSPHDKTSNNDSSNNNNSSVRFLNFNSKITALSAGTLDVFENKSSNHINDNQNITNPRDTLFIGTESTLSAYDVERNADLFTCEVPDGVNTMCIGILGDDIRPHIYAGGNCSILGFDNKGEEVFWTVTGDNVTSLALCDLTGDGKSFLIAGSEDFELRVFRKETIIKEITEADKVTFLLPLTKHEKRFAYGLANGTVGVYEGKKRLWRVKSKHQVTALHAFDIDSDGSLEIITGWSNGTFTIRREGTGQLLFRSIIAGGHPIAAILSGNYRMSGNDTLMVCSESGEVRGYLPFETGEVGFGNNTSNSLSLSSFDTKNKAIRNDKNDNNNNNNNSSGVVGTASSYTSLSNDAVVMQGGIPLSMDEKLLAALQSQKLELMQELTRLEQVIAADKETGINSSTSTNNNNNKGHQDSNRLPEGTTLKVRIDADVNSRCVLVEAFVSTDVNIVGMTVVDPDGAILGSGKEVLTITPPSPSSMIVVPLHPLQNQKCKLRGQVYIAPRINSEILHVEEMDIILPRFSIFHHLKDSSAMPRLDSTGVAFKLNESAKRFEEWLDESFFVKESVRRKDKLKAAFIGVCKNNIKSSDTVKNNSNSNLNLEDALIDTSEVGEPLLILAKEDMEGSNTVLHITIRCYSMQLAGEIIQDIGHFFDVQELESLATFPSEMSDFDSLVDRIETCMASRTRLTADLAEESQKLKGLVVRAEDSRIMSDIQTMRRAYTDLFTMNSQMTAQYNNRASNHSILMKSLREVNMIIQRAANLRIGSKRTRTINDCRTAVKSNNFKAFHRIVEQGHDGS